MTENISTQDARYAFDIVEAICTQVGPGIPGSLQERERAFILKKELETHLGSENVDMEEFSLAPEASLSPFPGAPFMIIAALLNISVGRLSGISPWLTTSLALVLSILTPLLFVLEFVFGLEVIDPIFRKKKSINIIGRLSPQTQRVKRLLILSGHHDSAPENTWLRYTGYGFFFLSVTCFLGMLILPAMSIIQIAGLILDDAGLVRAGTLGWVLLIYPVVPSIIYILFSTRGWKDGGNVPGAVDNLSASALTVAMCRFLVKNPDLIPPETEVRFISFGSEEVGLRGSRRYVERHLEELKHLDTKLLNYEMVGHPEIIILTSDLHGVVKNSSSMVEHVTAAAERAGVPYRLAPASFGVATDAVPFTRVGLEALTLLPFKVPQQTVAYYHTYRDTPEVLKIEPLFNVLKLTLEWIRCGGE